MIAQDHEVTEGLREITEEMRKITAGLTKTHDSGNRIWETAFHLAKESPDLMWPMMLLWNALTSLFDELIHEEKAKREAAMVQAAHEWLTLDTDTLSRETYFNHWLYEELGYDKTSD